MTPEFWETTASSVREGGGGGLPPADVVSEEIFLAPQTVVAEVVPLISPVQSLPMAKPCPYVDVRLKDAADKAMHVGSLVAYPRTCLARFVTLAVEACLPRSVT